MFILFAALISVLISAAFAQEGVVMQTGETEGTISVGGTCAPRSSSCLKFQNDHPGYPMEVVSVSYVSTAGRVVLESPPIIGAYLQCVLPGDGRPCAPVLAPGQMAAMQLAAPPAPGELITIRLRAWDPPGSEAGLPRTKKILAGTPVMLLGDPVAAEYSPATIVSEVTVTVGGGVSNFVNWGKGT